MTTITVSAMSPLPASSATYTYGITNVSTEGKVAVNATDGLPIFLGFDLIPCTVQDSQLGVSANRWAQLTLRTSGSVFFDDGTGNGNLFRYTNAIGPAFIDITTGSATQFNVQAYTGDHTVTLPDIDGTVTLGANVAKPVQVAPATGATVTVAPAGAVTVESINPAGTLANLTLAIGNGAYGGQIVYASFSQVITALAYGGTNITATGGQALPAAATLGQCMGFVWSDTATKWTRFL